MRVLQYYPEKDIMRKLQRNAPHELRCRRSFKDISKLNSWIYKRITTIIKWDLSHIILEVISLCNFWYHSTLRQYNVNTLDSGYLIWLCLVSQNFYVQSLYWQMTFIFIISVMRSTAGLCRRCNGCLKESRLVSGTHANSIGVWFCAWQESRYDGTFQKGREWNV